MPDVIPFDEAVAATDGRDRSLLIGNGFSIEFFNYRTLLQNAGLADDDPLWSLFDALETADFEMVIRALEEAAVVEGVYDQEEQAARLRGDAQRLREALVHSIRATHPEHREDIVDRIPSCVQFLKHFATLFSLNYDLLLYWVQLDLRRQFRDGFGLGDERAGFLGPFKEGAHCEIYNVHGGLHLFKRSDGEVEKRLMGSTGVIDAIARTITADRRLPLYVAEGTWQGKMAKINSVRYLRHCYEQLKSSEGMFFIYGHSANQNDRHIYRALFNSNIDHLYFCIHRPTADLNEIDGELARYKHRFGSAVDYTFVDAESARVWDRPAEEREDE